MEQLLRGTYYGIKTHSIVLKNAIVTETEYTALHVPWHYHENAYFSYLLNGSVKEINKKENFACVPGTIIYRNWQEAHANSRLSDSAKGFHIELDQDWFSDYGINKDHFCGSFLLGEEAVKSLFVKIYKEMIINDDASKLSIEGLLLQIFALIGREKTRKHTDIPIWLVMAKDMLHDQYAEKLSLDYLSEKVGVHPAHLSKEFPKYFNKTLGSYLREVRITRAKELINEAGLALTDIGYRCGFYDQSHFIRCFKEACGLTPSEYQKITTDVKIIQLAK